MELNYVPMVGAAPLLFGISANEVIEIMQAHPSSERTGFIVGNFSYFYREPFLKMTFSETQGLHTIEVIPKDDMSVVMNGKILVDDKGYASDIVMCLTDIGGPPEEGLGILRFATLGIAIPKDLSNPDASLAMSNFLYPSLSV